MTKDQLIENITKKIHDAHPEIMGRNASIKIEGNDFSGLINYRDTAISLADVLMAMPHLKPTDDRNIVVGQAESVGNRDFIEVISRWNLTQPLTGQNIECLEWLNKLLTK